MPLSELEWNCLYRNWNWSGIAFIGIGIGIELPLGLGAGFGIGVELPLSELELELNCKNGIYPSSGSVSRVGTLTDFGWTWCVNRDSFSDRKQQ